MPKYNRQFDLTIADIDLIETALQQKVSKVSHERLALLSSTSDDAEAIENAETRLADLQDLLGRLHNQKTFYRPSAKADAYYVGG